VSALAQRFPVVTKEVRALFPLWAPCVLTVGAGLISRDYTVLLAGALATVFGLVTLGAQSFGHEYTHRTLASLLAQPADRRRVFLIKYGVMAVMVLLLAALAWRVRLRIGAYTIPPTFREPEWLLLATACALFVAPWLTMVCRSVLAGVVFTIAVPGLLTVGGDVVGAMFFGLDRAADIDRFKYLLLWRGMIVVCAVAAVASWRTFMRLEAIEGHGAHLYLPQPIGLVSETASTSRRYGPIWALIGKEIRLQQISFVVVGLYALAWLTISWLKPSDPRSLELPLEALILLYSALLSLLIGALASAEERQYGTLESQLLLPMAGWQQWAVKAGVVLGLAVALAGAIPAALQYISPAAQGIRMSRIDWLSILLLTVPLATVGLYVSSLSSSGVRALLASFPVLVGLVIYLQVVEWTFGWVGTKLQGRSPGLIDLSSMVVLFTGWLPMLLVLGFRNHRSSDRGMGGLPSQAFWILGYITLFAAWIVL
jgi:hypothetical protein